MRFLVFAFDQYYPCGGWHDFIGPADTAEEATALLMRSHHDHGHVIDLETKQEVVWK